MKRPLRDMASKLIERIEAVENVLTDDFVYDLPTSRCEIEGFSRTIWSDQDNDVRSIGWDLSRKADFVPLWRECEYVR